MKIGFVTGSYVTTHNNRLLPLSAIRKLSRNGLRGTLGHVGISFIHGAQQDLVAIYEALERPEEARRFRDELARAKMQNATIADTK